MAGCELFSRWRAAGAGVLALLGVWACLNPETDDFPTYEDGAGGSGATAVDPGAGGSSLGSAGGSGRGNDGAAGGFPAGGSGGFAGSAPQPPGQSQGPDAGVPDAGPADAGGLVSDGG